MLQNVKMQKGTDSTAEYFGFITTYSRIVNYF